MCCWEKSRMQLGAMQLPVGPALGCFCNVQRGTSNATRVHTNKPPCPGQQAPGGLAGTEGHISAGRERAEGGPSARAHPCCGQTPRCLSHRCKRRTSTPGSLHKLKGGPGPADGMSGGLAVAWRQLHVGPACRRRRRPHGGSEPLAAAPTPTLSAALSTVIVQPGCTHSLRTAGAPERRQTPATRRPSRSGCTTGAVSRYLHSCEEVNRFPERRTHAWDARSDGSHRAGSAGAPWGHT